MEPFISQRYQTLLTRHGLHTFAGFWDLPWNWVEEPNRRRKGWSGVSHHTLFDEEAGQFSIFVKRQQNYNYRSFSHPLRGTPTAFRERHFTLARRRKLVEKINQRLIGKYSNRGVESGKETLVRL